MGVFTQRIEIGSLDGERFEGIEALVDTGASYTAAPRSLLERLGISPHRRQRLRIAEAATVEMDIGRAWVRVDGRTEMALVAFGREEAIPVLGATTLQLLGLGVDSLHERLIEVDGYMLQLGRM